MYNKMNLNQPIYVRTEDRNFIYKIVSVEELGSMTHCLRYEMELVAGYDYIEPDYNNRQGYITPNMFTESVQYESISVYPLEESLKESLESDGYEVINIDDFKIHEVKLEGEDEDETIE